MTQKTPLPFWGNTHISRLVGTSNVMIGRYLNGLSYPTLQMMQKFEVVFGWPVREQVDLVPYYWTWPDQYQTRAAHGARVPQQDPTDLRYGMMFNKILREWEAANPRTQPLQEIVQHPAIPHKRVQPGEKP